MGKSLVCLIILLTTCGVLIKDSSAIYNAKNFKETITDIVNLSFEEKYFIHINPKLNWFDAQFYCLEANMSMLVLLDAESQRNISTYLLSKGIKKHFWTAGNDVRHEKFFSWSTNAFPFRYSNWAKNQPDNHGTKDIESGEHCVEMRYYNDEKAYKWNDYNCEAKSSFICEIAERPCSRYRRVYRPTPRPN